MGVQPSNLGLSLHLLTHLSLTILQGLSALHIAAMHGSAGVVDLLVGSGECCSPENSQLLVLTRSIDPSSHVILILILISIAPQIMTTLFSFSLA